MTFIAPKLVGGKGATTPIEGRGIPLMSDAIKLYDMSISRFGEDILLEGYVKGDVCLQE
jgi:diaminohydroxyphosphoribosylaminopyrimidine deaminase/5-amino-6-(5-phosphoribosylamino)uracil reductase